MESKITLSSVYFIVTPDASKCSEELEILFDTESGLRFTVRQFSQNEPELDFVSRFILDELGIEFEDPLADKIDDIIDEYKGSFPNTYQFSQKARLTLPEVNACEDPDLALIEWIFHEERMFRRLESKIVAKRIQDGFGEDNNIDVDGFIKYSLSVHNRRKSIMGHSLEHHLSAIFDAFKLKYENNAKTENGKRPDFLFPSLKLYNDASSTGDERLVMLGAKSTCKDRWRQVLTEADKIPKKHLLTLERGISGDQTNQMQAEDLQLIVPQGLQNTYNEDQQSWLWTLSDFINEVRSRPSD